VTLLRKDVLAEGGADSRTGRRSVVEWNLGGGGRGDDFFVLLLEGESEEEEGCCSAMMQK